MSNERMRKLAERLLDRECQRLTGYGSLTIRPEVHREAALRAIMWVLEHATEDVP